MFTSTPTWALCSTAIPAVPVPPQRFSATDRTAVSSSRCCPCWAPRPTSVGLQRSWSRTSLPCESTLISRRSQKDLKRYSLLIKQFCSFHKNKKKSETLLNRVGPYGFLTRTSYSKSENFTSDTNMRLFLVLALSRPSLCIHTVTFYTHKTQ